ncbi:hypothetical protein HYW74_02875 [Candidatus Pacearchaeota archaeon]|nr:hypothetical protein [Candidatus Pacearchaeota archaeon]
MRNEFGKIIAELAKKDDKIILVVGDIGFGIFNEFIKNFPDRYFNFGVCEQSMVSAAAGMALQGLKPYVYTITPFITDRAFEQVKNDIHHQNVNVKLVGYADYPNFGPTHDEFAGKKEVMQYFTNIVSYFPKTIEDVRQAVLESYESEKPAFISLKKAPKISLNAHYICLGECGGSSNNPGNCQDSSCSLYGKPLVLCNCEDGKHIYNK